MSHSVLGGEVSFNKQRECPSLLIRGTCDVRNSLASKSDSKTFGMFESRQCYSFYEVILNPKVAFSWLWADGRSWFNSCHSADKQQLNLIISSNYCSIPSFIGMQTSRPTNEEAIFWDAYSCCREKASRGFFEMSAITQPAKTFPALIEYDT